MSPPPPPAPSAEFVALPAPPPTRPRQAKAPIVAARASPLVERVQPHLELNDKRRMPMLGLGTWNAQGKELKDAVKSAIAFGYRHIDTASNYKNEHIVGEAIRECLDEGLVQRQELFVTTKLWNNSHERDSVPVALRKSLQALQLDYVNLYLVHYPIGYQEGDTLSPLDAQGRVITSDVDYVHTWAGMEQAKRLGLTRSIGVSNFSAKQIARILEHGSIVPAVNQVECHPYLNQEKLIRFCRSHSIEVTAYSPLGSPGRVDPKLSQPYLIEDPVVVQLSKRHQRPASHVLIAYQIQRKVAVIPKAIQPAHIRSNFEALANFELSSDDMRRLDALNRNYRFMQFERCLGHKYYPFSDEF